VQGGVFVAYLWLTTFSALSSGSVEFTAMALVMVLKQSELVLIRHVP
jgi:hypothetical protein